MTGKEILEFELNKFRPLLRKGSINELMTKQLGDLLTARISFFSSPVIENVVIPNLMRVTVNNRLPNNKNERISEIKFLKNPPSENVKRLGRANFAGQSVFYAGFDPMTILKELKPSVGDLITVSTWKQKEDSLLNISPICNITSKDGESHNETSLRFKVDFENSLRKLDRNIAEQIELMVAFISECFAKEVDGNNHFDYFLSSYYANRIFSELHGGIIDAIIYPSVAFELSFSNAVLKSNTINDKFDLIEIEESIVKSSPYQGGNGYFLKGINRTSKFDKETGIINWNN